MDYREASGRTVKTRIETENVIFGLLVTMAVTVTFAMGWVLYSTPTTPPETTLRILSASGEESVRVHKRLNEEFKKIHPEIK